MALEFWVKHLNVTIKKIHVFQFSVLFYTSEGVED